MSLWILGVLVTFRFRASAGVLPSTSGQINDWGMKGTALRASWVLCVVDWCPTHTWWLPRWEAVAGTQSARGCADHNLHCLSCWGKNTWFLWTRCGGSSHNRAGVGALLLLLERSPQGLMLSRGQEARWKTLAERGSVCSWSPVSRASDHLRGICKCESPEMGPLSRTQEGPFERKRDTPHSQNVDTRSWRYQLNQPFPAS